MMMMTITQMWLRRQRRPMRRRVVSMKRNLMTAIKLHPKIMMMN